MNLVSYRSVLELWCDFVGIAVSQVLTSDSDSFNRLFNRVARAGWEHQFWPELMLGETRVYRPAWTAAVYTSAAEVYYSATAGSYWQANATTLTTDVPGVSTKWDLISMLDAYIDRDQAGQTPIGAVKEVRDANPRTTRSTYRILHEIDERGVSLLSSCVPTSVWVYFRQRCPAWKGATFDPALTYAIGKTRYYSSASDGFDGDFWTTIAATAAGESPETTPAKWSKVPVPAFLCDFAAHGAKLGYLEGDGQLDKALAAEGGLWTHLYDEIDQIRAQGGAVRTARVANI